MATKFCTVAPMTYGSRYGTGLIVIHLESRILGCLTDFVENLCTIALRYYNLRHHAHLQNSISQMTITECIEMPKITTPTFRSQVLTVRDFTSQ